MNEEKPIIIAGKNIKDYLLVIGQRGLTENSIKLHFSDKHTGTAEYLLRILRKSFGWGEIEREKKETMNLRCIYDISELEECKKCGSQRMKKICSNKEVNALGGCQEEIRARCKGYKRKYNNLFIVNEVTIEKVAQARV